jgi:hypothetical protein
MIEPPPFLSIAGTSYFSDVMMLQTFVSNVRR